MSSRSTVAGITALAALMACVFAGGDATASVSSIADTTAIQASGKEFHIGLSRSKVKPGKLRVEFVNYGQDDHDLAITRKGSSTNHRLSTVHPGERATMTISTKRGSYVFWCTISDHKSRGMRAVLKVRR